MGFMSTAAPRPPKPPAAPAPAISPLVTSAIAGMPPWMQQQPQPPATPAPAAATPGLPPWMPPTPPAAPTAAAPIAAHDLNTIGDSTIPPQRAGTPTPPAAPAAPAAPAQTPAERAAADTAAGIKHNAEDGIGAAGSLGRIKDTYSADTADLLARQKAALDGMTPAEMQAAKEQGTATINGQLATNMQQMGDVAAANGIRGGSAAGLQMQALAGAQNASGTLARQMILDNVAQKNIAMDRYGNTLSGDRAFDTGLQGANNDYANREAALRQADASGFSSLIDSYRSGDKADALNNRGLDLTQQQIDAFKSTGGFGGNATAGGSGAGFNKIDPADTYKVKQLKATEAQDIKDITTSGDQGKQAAGLDSLHKAIEERINLENPGEPEQTRKDMIQQEFDKQRYLMNGQNETGTGPGSRDTGGPAAFGTQPSPAGGAVICTEAHRQGLVAPEVFSRAYYDGSKYITQAQLFAYWRWGTKVAAAMQKYPLLAQAVAKLVPPAVREIGRRTGNEKQAWTLSGWLLVEAFDLLNKLFAH